MPDSVLHEGTDPDISEVTPNRRSSGEAGMNIGEEDVGVRREECFGSCTEDGAKINSVVLETRFLPLGGSFLWSSRRECGRRLPGYPRLEGISAYTILLEAILSVFYQS